VGRIGNRRARIVREAGAASLTRIAPARNRRRGAAVHRKSGPIATICCFDDRRWTKLRHPDQSAHSQVVRPNARPPGDDMADHSKKDEAQEQFKKLQRVEDGKKAMAEYEAEAAATRVKTARLRALRLARDAAEGPAASPAKKKKGAKQAKGTLSDWLKDREGSGHNN
jgi:hypothetical protein